MVPRVSPIRKGFFVSCNVHGNPQYVPVALQNGFNTILIDDLKPYYPMEYYQKFLPGVTIGGSLNWYVIGNTDVDWVKKLWKNFSLYIRGIIPINEPNGSPLASGNFTGGIDGYCDLVARLHDAVPEASLILGNLATVTSARWQDWIAGMATGPSLRQMPNSCVGIHTYADNGPDAVKQFTKVKNAYRAAGFTQPAICTEFGFQGSEEKVARWTTYFLSKLSRMPDVVGASFYELSNVSPWSAIDLGHGEGQPKPVLARVKEAVG